MEFAAEPEERVAPGASAPPWLPPAFWPHAACCVPRPIHRDSILESTPIRRTALNGLPVVRQIRAHVLPYGSDDHRQSGTRAAVTDEQTAQKRAKHPCRHRPFVYHEAKIPTAAQGREQSHRIARPGHLHHWSLTARRHGTLVQSKAAPHLNRLPTHRLQRGMTMSRSILLLTHRAYLTQSK